MPFDNLPPRAAVSAIAFTSLMSMSVNSGHTPSMEQWAAIRDLLNHLEQSANDKLEPAVYVSAIPAGTGKTTALAEFAKALMADPAHSGAGMLITCNRVEEVEAMARLLSAWRHCLCVIVGIDHPEVIALGDHAAANEAQIAVCTQAALKRTLKGSLGFDDAARFHYRGRRRAVVCWDEAFAFSRPVVLNPDDAMKLTSAISAQSADAKVALLQWAIDVDQRPAGVCVIPDFAALGVDFRVLEPV